MPVFSVGAAASCIRSFPGNGAAPGRDQLFRLWIGQQAIV